MKKIILLILALFVFINSRGAITDTLMIRYSDWDRVTTNVSTCSNFEIYNGYEEEYVVSLSSHNDTLKTLLSHLQEKEDEYFPVRCKLYFYDTDTIRQKVCMNKTNIALDGKTFANNDKIINYINHLRKEYAPSNTNRFMPNYMGANYVEGNDSLYRLLTNVLDSITASCQYHGLMILSIKCKAAKNGATTDTKVEIKKPKQPTKVECYIAKKLRKYIRKNIYWERDIERNNFDHIAFAIRYVGRNID